MRAMIGTIMKTRKREMRRNVMSLILAGVTACTLLGSFSVQASEETTSSADSTDSSAKTTTIGVAISSSTDTFGSQVKKLIDEAARVLDVSVNYCDHGDTASLVQEAPQMLIDSGCQGIVMVGADDSAMETALTACGNSRVYLAQAVGSISPSDGAVYQAAETSPWYIGAVDAAENLSDESGAESAAVQAESTVSASSSPAAAGTDQTAAGTAAAAAGTSAGTAMTAYQTHRNGEFVEPLYAFLMVYNALNGSYSGFDGKIRNIAFPQIETNDMSAYETYFVAQLPYSDEEIKALAGESLEDLAKSAASLSVEDAKARAESPASKAS